MRWVGRAFGVLLIVLILVVTPIAFWAFNVDRVTMNPQTYLTALKSQHFYDNLLPGLVDAAASDKSGDPTIRAVSTALMENMTPDDWVVLSDKLMPPAVLQQELTNNIVRFFEWIGGSGTTPDIQFSLQTLKSRLTGPDARSAAQIVVPKLPACSASQEQILTSSSLDTNPSKDALCNPESAGSRKNAVDNLTSIFNTLGKNLPDSWKLNSIVGKYSSVAPNTAPGGGLTEIGLVRFRATLWLGNQLVVLLFLIPVALFALIIVVTVRSAKGLFRWLGWVLILSGLITSVPVPFLSTVLLTLSPAMQNDIQRGAGSGGRILASLAGGMVGSIFAGLTLAVLIQAGIVIVIGFICVFVSVMLPAPAPDVTPEEVAQEQRQLAADDGASTPYFLSATPSFMPRQAPAAAPTPQPAVASPVVLLPPDAPTYMPPSGPSSPPPAESSGTLPKLPDDGSR